MRISPVFKSSIVAEEREKPTVRYIAMHTHRNYNDVTRQIMHASV
jgi:hypothetical protein